MKETRGEGIRATVHSPSPSSFTEPHPSEFATPPQRLTITPLTETAYLELQAWLGSSAGNTAAEGTTWALG